RGRGHERLDERASPEALEGGHVALERCPVNVRDRPLGARRGHEVHHRAAEVRHLELEEARVPDDVLHRRTPALPGEAAHAMLQVREEALAWLLAVVADVDTGGALARDDLAGRLL